MRNILFVMIALFALVASSCQKTEVYSDELTTSVVFKPMMEEDLTINKSGDLNRDALGGLADIAIKTITVSAIHEATNNNDATKTFTVRDGYGDNVIRLDNIRLGMNRFMAETTSYPEIPQTDPFASESDGFSSYNQTYPTDNTDKTVESTVANLRAIRPFVEFSGETDEAQLITYNDCEEECNQVNIFMEAQQGRWIATVEFADNNLAINYEATVKVSHDGGPMGPAPARTVDINHDAPFAWFYMTHVQCTDDLFITMHIVLREKGNDIPVREWTLTSATNENEIAIEEGVDRWVQIIIGKDALKSGCVDFNFTWDWEVIDTDDIIL